MRFHSSSWHRGWCVVMLASVTGCASAPPTRSFADLPGRIDVGTRVSVVTTEGEAATGRVETLHAQALAMVADETRREFPAERVERITRKKRHVVAGLLIGLGVGTVIGVAGASTSEPTGSPVVDVQFAGASILAGMLLGTAAGAGVGALIQTERTIYIAPVSAKP
jgi:hypothetical protein